jgi:hypothetical protein
MCSAHAPIGVLGRELTVFRDNRKEKEKGRVVKR